MDFHFDFFRDAILKMLAGVVLAVIIAVILVSALLTVIVGGIAIPVSCVVRFISYMKQKTRKKQRE